MGTTCQVKAIDFDLQFQSRIPCRLALMTTFKPDPTLNDIVVVSDTFDVNLRPFAVLNNMEPRRLHITPGDDFELLLREKGVILTPRFNPGNAGSVGVVLDDDPRRIARRLEAHVYAPSDLDGPLVRCNLRITPDTGLTESFPIWDRIILLIAAENDMTWQVMR